MKKKKARKQKNKHTQPPTSSYLLLRLIDPEQKHQLRQKHGCRCVGMDAPDVGLKASEAGEHQDSEEEGQHGEAQGGICDHGQRLQIPLQLLLKSKGEGREGIIKCILFW